MNNKYFKINILIYILLIILCTKVTKGQNTKIQEEEITDNSESKFSNKLFIDGIFGLQFGDITIVNLSPVIGYKFTKRISAGVGITYEYINYKPIKISTNVYGGRIIGRYSITDNIFAHIEYEILSLEPMIMDYNYSYNILEKRRLIDSFFVGGGYRQSISDNVSANILLLWNLNESIYSPYSNPVIRAGINVGF